MAGAALALASLLCGCGTLDFYFQAAAGQYEIWHKQQPISQLLTRTDTPAALLQKLALVVALREFAFTHLALPDRGSYRDYVDLDRDFVIWNVFVAPELALAPLKSCFPLAGCLEYRGFFSSARAERHAAHMRAQGFDTFVGGVAAYSTLGWFDDPVLSTILRWDDQRIAEIIFHELAHQRLYVAGDTTFNESFAMAVAAAGLEAWLTQNGETTAGLLAADRHKREFIDLILAFRQRLAQAFGAAVSDTEKRARKRQLYDELRAQYEVLKAGWNGDASYDEWMATDLNNAKIASISTYHDHVDAFMSILRRYDRSFQRFYAAIERLSVLDAAARTRCLQELAADPALNGGVCSTVFD